MQGDIKSIKAMLTDSKNIFCEEGDKHSNIQKLASELFNQLKKSESYR